MIVRKSPSEIEAMARAGAIHSQAMALVGQLARPGVTTLMLDQQVEEFIRSKQAAPTFKGYQGFPASICASVNDLVVHGIPGSYCLSEGDILAIDIGVTYKGWTVDGAATLAIGTIGPSQERLLATAYRALWEGSAAARAGNYIADISAAIETRVTAAGFSLLEGLTGHGIGRAMHEDPDVPNQTGFGRGAKLETGMVLAIEPMVMGRNKETRAGQDGWALYAADGEPSAHFEFTVAVTADGPSILTPWHKYLDLPFADPDIPLF